MKLLTIYGPMLQLKNIYIIVFKLLAGGEEGWNLIINDGSKEQHCSHCPTNIPQLINDYPLPNTSENKGHGGAVNTGMANTTGKYFKVVDSDDWVDVRAYLTI